MTTPAHRDQRPWAVFLIFLRLGLTSFGGPVAHLAYFRDEFVTRRRWLSERSYADLLALCQFLPGPASSQVGMALGLGRCGYLGAMAAWVGFTLPSAVLLMLLALGITEHGDAIPEGAVHGLKVVAVAVVAQAVWGMGRNLCPDVPRVAIMAVAAGLALLAPPAWSQVAIMLGAAVLGLLVFCPTPGATHDPLPIRIGKRSAVLWLGLFFALLVALPLLSRLYPAPWLAIIDAFYRSGALVFGGGHLVLPVLHNEVVPPGWVSEQTFVAGYGAAQAVPGPLFTFAAFLGAAMSHFPSPWVGGLVCLAAIFLPAFLLVACTLPFWEQVRHNTRMQAAMMGLNAAVVGLLLAALYNPVWTSAIHQPTDLALALVALLALTWLKLPPWLVVIASSAAGWALSVVG